MLLSKIFSVLKRVSFFIRFFFYKSLYFQKLNVKRFWSSRADSGLLIDINKGRLIIGESFISRRGLSIRVSSGNLTIGNRIFFNENVSINCHNAISIGNDCLFGESVKIYDHNHRFSELRCINLQGFSSSPILIGNNVWLGSNVIVLKGVQIGENSVVAAGSVVDKDIPANMIFKRCGTLVPINRS